jgi:GNAT superfamily N-acetyltransferase
MELRLATTADLAAEEAVFRAAIGELYERHRLPPPNPPTEAFRAQHGHLLHHDAERCWVAEDDGRVVGFSAALVRGDAWHLAALFVLPEAQGAGLGKRLLDAVWGAPELRRRVLTDAIQPVSNGLYASPGLIPVTPVLHLAGTPRAVASTLDAVDPQDDVLVALDLAAYGFDRTVDHEYWRGIGTCTVWLRAGEPSAYSYAYPWGTIGPVAGVDGAAAADALRGELARAAGDVNVVIPGSSRELVGAAIEAGLRFTRPPGLLLLGPGVGPPSALAISGYALL